MQVKFILMLSYHENEITDILSHVGDQHNQYSEELCMYSIALCRDPSTHHLDG